jgi:signal transduction histidine kinase
MHRAVLIERCRLMVAQRSSPKATDADLAVGIPIFLDQIIETLRVEQTSERGRSPQISGVAGGGTPSQIGDMATLHGRNLLIQGFTLEQVVRDYGNVCQAVTNLAYDLGAAIEVDEFRSFNRCIDNAIASAVGAYALQQAAAVDQENVLASNSRMGSLVHELRNYLQIVTYAVHAIKTGNVGIAGATGAVLDRSLIGMRHLIDRSLAEVRITAGLPARVQPIGLAKLLRETEAGVPPELQSQGRQLRVGPVDDGITVTGDPEILQAAVFNLLHNAFKFTKRDTAVMLRVQEVADRVLIDVEDHCGGLPPGAAETLIRPFVQKGKDQSGLGLGLDIVRRGVEASNGVLRVRDVPGSGCVFTIDLPRHSMAVSNKVAALHTH